MINLIAHKSVEFLTIEWQTNGKNRSEMVFFKGKQDNGPDLGYLCFLKY